jgi:hypothetical protein
MSHRKSDLGIPRPRKSAKVVLAPVGFSATVGEEVPATVELYEMPSDIEYAAVRRYRYMVHDDRLYIVDPDTRKVVRVIN